MLGWLRSAPRSEAAVNAVPPEAGDESTWVPDAPETPAPVFAIRAFKTAIFGTPHDVEGVDERTTPEDDGCNKTRRSSGTDIPAMSVSDRQLRASSPTKKAGILLTPGAASNRRKTVSFGAAVVNNEAGSKSGLPSGIPGRYPSPWTPRAATPGSRRTRTNLTNSLYEARSTTSAANKKSKKDKRPRQKDLGADFIGGPGAVAMRGGAGELEQDMVDSEEEGDVTLDLDKPRSRSGRYWKTEYDQYQEKADHEMKKLVKYKHLARSYAKKKDSEAVDLAKKLREERGKVAEMEGKISELAAQMAASRVHGDGNGADRSDEIVRGLARQTALAVEYKDKVDRFQAALEQHGIPTEREKLETKKVAIPRTEHTLIQVGQELKRAREQLQEINLLQSEVEELRNTLKGAELKAQKLDEEKLSLSKDLEKAKEELERNDKRRIAREEKHKQREGKLVAQKNEYKERLSQAKSDHQALEEILKKRSSNERSNFEQDISSPEDRSRPLTEGDLGALEKLDQQCMSQQKTIKDYERQIADLRSVVAKDHGSTDESHDEWQQQQRKTLRELRQAREEVSNMRLERDAMQIELRECQAEVKRLRARSQPPSKGESDAQPPRFNDRVSYDTPDKRYKPRPAVEVSSTPAIRGSLPSAALLDLSANPSCEISTPEPQSPERTRGSTRHHERRYSLDSPLLALPSPEVFTSRATRGQSKTYDSPRPSFFNIPSSPPRMQPLSLPPKTTAVPLPPPPSRQSAGTGVRRTESLQVAKTRTRLPPERLAAAKARLEQRNAEKKLLQVKAPQKENVVPGIDM